MALWWSVWGVFIARLFSSAPLLMQLVACFPDNRRAGSATGASPKPSRCDLGRRTGSNGEMMWWIMRAWASASQTSAAFFISARNSERAVARANIQAERKAAATARATEVQTVPLLGTGGTSARACLARTGPKWESRLRPGEALSPSACRRWAQKTEFRRCPLPSPRLSCVLLRFRSPLQLCPLQTITTMLRTWIHAKKLKGLELPHA